jgi:uncharacterized protein YjbI with pentapeptide repeats
MRRRRRPRRRRLLRLSRDEELSMIVGNSTGFSFATKLTSRQPPRPEMMLVVKASFRLTPGEPLVLLDYEHSVPRGDMFAEGDDERALECSYPSDFADAKLNAEVFLRGSFHPRGRSLKTAEVAFGVGRWSKRLRVVGPRAFADDALGSVVSEPLALGTVPLRWSQAYGGGSFPANPAGVGHVSGQAPQVESLEHPVKSRGNHNRPASFGPINPSWQERAGKLGTRYGKDWQETRAPFVAEDFDWGFHHAAPADQQISGFLRGDETLSFENLHPASGSFQSKLPGLRARAFARLVGGAFVPIPLALDTLIADLEKEQLHLLWRGHLAVRERDLSDVKSLYIASEALGVARTEREYEARLGEFERDPAGVEAARRDALARMEAAIPAAPGEPPALPDAVSRALEAKLEGFPTLKRHVAIGMGEASKASAPDRDMPGELSKAVQAAADAADDAPPPPVGPKPGAMPSMGLRRAMRGIQTEVARMETELAGRPIPKERAAELEKLRRVPHDPEWPKLDPEYSVPEPLSSDEPGPGANLVDHDLTGRDLSGLDLSGARLDGAVLTRAKLNGTKLVGASLRGAVLFRAEARNADFTGADLTRANLARISATGARFYGATLELAFFEDALLSAASFDYARGEWPAFARADLSGASGRSATIYRGDFAEARLSGASFVGASLRGCVLARAEASDLDLSDADIAGLSAEGVKLPRAKLVRAVATRSNFNGAELDNADCSLATLQHSHFRGSRMRDAELWGADLRGAQMARADISGSRFDGASLMGADLCNASVSRARFIKANLYDAKLYEAAGEDADFSGANLERCVFTKRKTGEGDRA